MLGGGGGGGGGANGSKVFPGFVEENGVRYDAATLPQLQLFGHIPIQCSAGVGATTNIGTSHVPVHNMPVNIVREGETLSVQQKLQISLNNNFCPDDAGRIGTVLNPNHPVSTGLKLSCEEEERNSTVTSTCENMKTNPLVAPSIGNVVQMEIDRQTEEFCQYIKLQEENILKGVRELNQRHTITLLNALEKGVHKKLHEKEVEIENMSRKNKELGEQVKQATMEAQSWHYRAKYNESVINVLKSNIQQLMAQGTTQAREGSGDSEVDDAISSSNHPRVMHQQQNRPPKCRACGGKDVAVLILPCRHLCLCLDCEGFIEVCPVCQVMKNASVHVYM